jgi:hypothetical protein
MEVSRNVLAALLLLVIVVSGIGTYGVLSRAGPSSPSMGGSQTLSPGNGDVRLVVQESPTGQGAVVLDVRSEALYGTQ